MALTKEQKHDLLSSIVEKMKASKSIVFANCSGISVKDQQNIRRSLRSKNAEFKVAKKTLIKLAAKELDIEIPDESINGQIAVCFSFGEPITAPQELKTYSKKLTSLSFSGGIFEGRVLSKNEVQELADLPSKEVLLAKFLRTLMSPIQGFVSCSSGVVGGFVRVLNAYKEQKEKTCS